MKPSFYFSRRHGVIERSYILIVLLALGFSCILFTQANALASDQRPLDLLYTAADRDGNGLISETEWHTAMQQRFEEIDTNNDGQVTQQEMAASRETAKQRFRAMRQSGGVR